MKVNWDIALFVSFATRNKQCCYFRCHIYDADGNELVQDKGRDVKYTVLLNRRNPLPLAQQDDGEEVRLWHTTAKAMKRLLKIMKKGCILLSIYAELATPLHL